MQTEDLPQTPGSRPFPADAIASLDAEAGEAEPRADGSTLPLFLRLPLRAFSERNPRREASRRMPETISAH